MAVENRNAVVELYDISAAKLCTYSLVFRSGARYYLISGDRLLPEELYVYMISNGKQKQVGRITKQKQ